MGYAECGTDFDLEEGYEKVALFVDRRGAPTHMARQLPSGFWTSKLGSMWDVVHQDIHGVAGEAYGAAALALRKPLRRS